MFNIANGLRVKYPNTHWNWVIDSLSAKMHDPASKTLFHGEIDDIFFFKQRIKKPNYSKVFDECHAWVGVSHQHRAFLDAQDFKHNTINRYINKCHCMVVLSDYMKEYWLSKFPKLNIIKIFHPIKDQSIHFSLNAFKQKGQIRELGRWGRKFDTYKQLNSPYPKLAGSNNKHLPLAEFNKLFLNTVQFIDLVDASANNGVLECIIRNTPILISKHPAVMEYLGHDYPLYFSNLEEANNKINDLKLIISAHEYLKSMDKHFISIDNFINNIKRI